jgi:hypothetical protein
MRIEYTGPVRRKVGDSAENNLGNNLASGDIIGENEYC